MTLLLHAITLSPETAPALDGVSRQVVGRLTAWATPLEEGAAPFTRADMLSHHHLVEAIFGGVDALLPARFPTLLAYQDELRDRLASREKALLAQLERVRGCAEVAVTALWTAPDDSNPRVSSETPGRRYLLERQAQITGSERRHARAKALAQQLELHTGDELVDARHTFCPSALIGLSSALLVRRGRVADVRARLVRAEQDVRILVNGPWPPYTFAAVGSD